MTSGLLLFQSLANHTNSEHVFQRLEIVHCTYCNAPAIQAHNYVPVHVLVHVCFLASSFSVGNVTFSSHSPQRYRLSPSNMSPRTNSCKLSTRLFDWTTDNWSVVKPCSFSNLRSERFEVSKWTSDYERMCLSTMYLCSQPWHMIWSRNWPPNRPSKTFGESLFYNKTPNTVHAQNVCLFVCMFLSENNICYTTIEECKWYM